MPRAKEVSWGNFANQRHGQLPPRRQEAIDRYWKGRYSGVSNTSTVAHSETRPQNEYAALMQCAPGQEPDTTLDTLAPLRDIIADAIETLTAREQFIFDALFTQRLSLRQLSRQMQLSKTHLARVRDEITDKLRAVLVDDPAIQEYLCQ